MTYVEKTSEHKATMETELRSRGRRFAEPYTRQLECTTRQSN